MAKYPIASLKCIDLSNPDINQSAELIRQACLESGIFYVINHGISKELIDEVFAQNKKLFGMTQNEKMKLIGKEIYKPRGYEAPKQKDYVERYTLGLHDDISNVWPSSDILPGWKETMQKYSQETFDAGMAVLRIVAVSLGVNTDFFHHSDLLGGSSTASLCISLHYGDQESDSTKNKLGLYAHNDGSFITLLATDDISGLQICKDKNAKPQIWEDVPPMKGSFIVVVGEMMQRLTNDVYRAVHHRTAYRQERYCIGVFLVPSYNWVMESLPSCVSKENPLKYPKVKFYDFVYANLDIETLDETNNKVKDAED